MSDADRSGQSPAGTAVQLRRVHLGFRIGRIARLLRQRYEARAKHLGLTPAQMHALIVVRYNEGRSQRSIAETLDVGEVTAGRLICRLEADGLIERRPDSKDGRVMRVYLAQGAAAMLLKLDEIATSEEQKALAGIGSALIDDLVRGLDAISANLGRPVDLSRMGDEE